MFFLFSGRNEQFKSHCYQNILYFMNKCCSAVVILDNY